jgi:coenzyme F420-0:L-glutamate ligase/coenzyme F420-1:gamma-L-glutamate ligase
MLTVFALNGIPEIVKGDNLAELIARSLADEQDSDRALRDGDILAVTSKIVSKAEGRTRPASEREQAIDDETVRVVAVRANDTGITKIVENRLGIIGAAAGVDASNTSDGTVLLLPFDPDASAAAIRTSLQVRYGIRLGVIVTDTLGRAWREGQTDVAIGASGVLLLEDLSGTPDGNGRPLAVTAPAVGDEIAAAADLVKRKNEGRPVAVVRGLAHYLEGDAPGARVLQREASKDWFRLGSDEAYHLGYQAAAAEQGRSPLDPGGGVS